MKPKTRVRLKRACEGYPRGTAGIVTEVFAHGSAVVALHDQSIFIAGKSILDFLEEDRSNEERAREFLDNDAEPGVMSLAQLLDDAEARGNSRHDIRVKNQRKELAGFTKWRDQEMTALRRARDWNLEHGKARAALLVIATRLGVDVVQERWGGFDEMAVAQEIDRRIFALLDCIPTEGSPNVRVAIGEALGAWAHAIKWNCPRSRVCDGCGEYTYGNKGFANWAGKTFCGGRCLDAFEKSAAGLLFEAELLISRHNP